MAWLNTPVEIIEDERIIYEEETFYWLLTGGTETRKRKVTYTSTRYVGCDYTAAKAKADALAATTGYEDVHLTPADGGQYHVLATLKVAVDWPPWSWES